MDTHSIGPIKVFRNKNEILERQVSVGFLNKTQLNGMTEPYQELLIHAVKSTRYRFSKAISGSHKSFGSFRISPETRSPDEIINHLYDLSAKTKSLIAYGHFNVQPPRLLNLKEETARFFSSLDQLQAAMENVAIDLNTCKRILQGPIADMVSHIGQIAMLNGLHGNKIIKENYYDADIK